MFLVVLIVGSQGHAAMGSSCVFLDREDDDTENNSKGDVRTTTVPRSRLTDRIAWRRD